MLQLNLRQVLCVALSITSPAVGQTCYNPDRTTAPNAVPCSTNATNSGTFCCDPDAICLSTGYCLSVTSQPYQLYRGSCTDSGWGDFCAYYCVNYRTGSDAPITSVGLNDDGRAIYCCGDASGNQTSTECANGDPPFILEDASMVLGRAALVDLPRSLVVTPTLVLPEVVCRVKALPETMGRVRALPRRVIAQR